MMDRAGNSYCCDHERDAVKLEDKKITEIVITHHAQNRWATRVQNDKCSFIEIKRYLWDRLESGNIRSYYRKEEDVYVVDDDLLMVVEFAPADPAAPSSATFFYKLVAVTFLGRLSASMELRDLKTYYGWLRHSRRMSMLKSGRTRK
ncbi:hypothetical protein WMW72_02840 [Paenibacillus filicis]|uniref:Uncharacterized protein n=1 Tax=Paenibacillus filicis TaxID=669464 RepID=A0ABU9DFD0_9BACL